MNFFSYIKEAFWMLLQNKMRSFLSLLWIVIGISSVVILTAFWNGMKNKITKEMSATQNIIRIEKWSIESSSIFDVSQMQNNNFESHQEPSIEQKIASEKIFSEETVNLLQEVFWKNVKAIVPVINFSWRSPIFAGKEIFTSIRLVDKSFFNAKNATAERGFLFDKTTENVAVVGYEVVREFQDKDPVGKTIIINNSSFTIIGILSKTKDFATDRNIFIPYKAATERFGKQKINSIEIHAHRVEDMEELQKNIGFFLMKYSDATSPHELNFNLQTDKKYIESITKTISQISLFISGIAAISLLVWGIGIMNIMLVSVTERTREIGIRKAIGARRRDIVLQFLTESAILSLLGGIIAIIFSYIVTSLVTLFFPQIQADISIQIILIATSFSIGMGVFFGLMPAWKAAKMNAIDALRFE